MQSTHTSRGSALSGSPFFTTAEQRVAWARQRFFENGERPTGLVSEAVIQSWSRCLQLRQTPERRPEFNPVTASRIHSVLGRNRVLLQAAAAELQRLQHMLAGTSAVGILVDPQGVVMHTTWTHQQPDEQVLPAVARVGVSLAEDCVGTNAPGLTARTGLACTVMGEEHFAQVVHGMHCAAAPVHDNQGRVAAVLDLTSEGRPFGFDAAAVVGLYATAIENRLLCAQSQGQLLVSLQLDPSLLPSAMSGLLGVDGLGRVAWINPAAAALLGLGPVRPAPQGLSIEATLGQSLSTLLEWTRCKDARALRLPNGLTLWVQCRLDAGVAGAQTVPAVAAPVQAVSPAAADTAQAAPQVSGTLRDNDRQLVETTLRECGGNVSRTARRLGVSRGLVYRHLQALRMD